MKFFSIIIGIVVGIMVFSSHEKLLIGGIIGGAIAFLMANILVLQNKISDLEEKFNRVTRTTRTSPVNEKITTHQVIPPQRSSKPAQPIPELEIEVVADLQVQKQTASPAPPRPRPPVTIRTPIAAKVAPEKTEANRIEWLDIIVSYFTGGNVVVRVGVIVLFFGVGFLLKYSVERNMIPIEFRLAGISLGAIAMLVIGWRLRLTKTTYALIIQGGAIGLLYLTTFAALKLYHLIPIWLALTLLVALPVFSAALAIIQDARALAVIGIIGGFLAPVLTSTGGGSHIVLFSYYALLNGGILLVAWFKSWRELNLIGFVFTFVIGALWGSRSFQPELFSSTEPFLILFFCFYVALGLMFASNQPLQHKGYIDCTMVFGTPIICFGLQSALVKPYEYGIAWSALAMGTLYASLAWWTFKRGNAAMRTMIESFMALGVVFGTIAIPLALDGRWTAAAWALEGAAIIWIAIRQDRQIARIFGIGLQILAGFAFLSEISGPAGDIVVINGFYLGCLAVAGGAFFSAICLARSENRIISALAESRLLLIWALIWWFGAGIHEIDSFVQHYYKPATLLAFWSFSALTSLLAARKLAWSDLRHVHKSLLPVMIGTAGYWLIKFHSHPARHLGYLSWPLTFTVQYGLLYLDRKHCAARLLQLLHPLTMLLLVFLLSWEASWWTDHLIHGPGIWPLVTLALVPTFFVMFITRYKDSLPWPVSDYQETYLYHTLGPIVIYLFAGSILINLTNKGNPWPLAYLPFLNPLDLTQIMVLIVLIYWVLVLQVRMNIQPFSLNLRRLIICSGATIFFWLNAVLIRTLHYWGKVPFRSHQMLNSDLTQTSLSIFWTLSALAVMKWASHKMHRVVWMVGAALVGVVVVKLFTFDLANTGTVERIISFLGVGIICLVIGYLAPLPNKQENPGS
ncbi:MAG: DUF2339 domain-containing protein [Proteobacteria bacterium]|nr:DUF2339 domain-containing protein [Pseudomonadota bacterium]MBU1715350.1 DUF2339 domain-containing protein [Pseudomonadota bacterium]